MATPFVRNLHTIINNCDHILYLGNQDMNTAYYIAARAGKTPEAILSKPRDKAFLITSGEKARLVDKIIPYSTVADVKDKEETEEIYLESVFD